VIIGRQFEELKSSGWIDLHTRAVFVEMGLYNPATNLFTFFRMAAEFSKLGGCSVWKDTRTLAYVFEIISFSTRLRFSIVEIV
jgi:hypothetical protein